VEGTEDFEGAEDKPAYQSRELHYDTAQASSTIAGAIILITIFIIFYSKYIRSLERISP
jgi:hypothetical protein